MGKRNELLCTLTTENARSDCERIIQLCRKSVESSLKQLGRSVEFPLRYLIVINKSITPLAITSIGVYVLVESLQIKLRPFQFTFFLNGANVKSRVFEKNTPTGRLLHKFLAL